jgi:hypothetical protein
MRLEFGSFGHPRKNSFRPPHSERKMLLAFRAFFPVVVALRVARVASWPKPGPLYVVTNHYCAWQRFL